jgi:intracellular septation protein
VQKGRCEIVQKRHLFRYSYASANARLAAYDTRLFGSGAPMQLLFDFLPVIAFFAAYKISGSIFVATAVIIVAVVAQTTLQWVRHRKVSSMALISGTLVLVFGGLTLLIHDKAFIQWKVTVVNWLFAIAFIASRYFGDRTIIERLLGENLQLEPTLWRRLNWAWGLFFLALGAINLYVAYNYPETVWVNFKLFGVLGLTIVFALVQGFWLASKMPQSAESNPEA